MYDAMYQGSLHGDAEFYVDCARTSGAPVPEFGAGTGRISRFFAAAGLDVVAVDLSPDMLAAARVNTADDPGRDRITWLEGDMRTLDLDETFGSVIVPARSFMRVLTPGDQQRALAVFRKHLDPGGYLILDLFDPMLEKITATFGPEPEVSEHTHHRTGVRYLRSVTDRVFDLVTQIVEETILGEELNEGGDVVASAKIGWRLRWTFRQEVVYLLERAGFEIIAEYSDFYRAPPADAKEQLWLARAC